MPELTDQQRKAARLLAEGASGREVARQLGVSSSTITRWHRRADFGQCIAAWRDEFERSDAEIKRQEATAQAARPQKRPSDHDFDELAKGAALAALGALNKRVRAGDQPSSKEWAGVAATMAKFARTEDDTLTPAALAEALSDPEAAAAALDAMEVVDQAALLTALREREVERFKRDRDLGAPGVREALIATGRWAPPDVAAVWLERWGPVMALSKADLSRLISRSAHLEVAQQYGDAPDDGYAVIDQRHAVDQIEAVVSAANTPTEKDTDHAPAHDHA